MKHPKTILILVILFTFPAVFALLYHSMFTFHDETQIVNMYEYFKTMDLGQFPPRWGLDFHFNYGSPLLQFYYQLPYYLGYPFHLLGLSITDIFKLLLILSFFIGSIGMYTLGLHITTPMWALVSAVIYTYTPYRAVATYVRGSLGESFSLAFFPWVFLASYRFYKHPDNKGAILAGLSWTVMILTHQLATIFFIPLVGILGFIFLIKNHKIFKYILLAGLTSLLSSAYYLFPLVMESGYIKPSSPFNFYDHFPFLSQLIYSPWGYRASLWGIEDGLSFQLGIIPLFILAITILAAYALLKQKKREQERTTFLYLLAAIPVTIFLMNIRSVPYFWNLFPFTQTVQFPWRLLMLTSFLIPAAFLFVSKMIPKKNGLYFALLLLFVTPMVTIRFFQPGEIYDRNDDYYLHRFLPNQAAQDKAIVSEEYLNHTEDYVSLPIDAIRPSTLPAVKLTAIETDTTITVLAPDDPFNQKYSLDLQNADTITFHTFAYPNWQLELDSEPLEYQKDDLGAIIAKLPAGEHILTITYTKTTVQRISDLLSMLTISAAAIYLIKTRSKK